MRGRFDYHAFYVVIEQEKWVRGITWDIVARQTGLAYHILASLSGGKKQHLDTILALAHWADVSINDFVVSIDDWIARAGL